MGFIIYFIFYNFIIYFLELKLKKILFNICNLGRLASGSNDAKLYIYNPKDQNLTDWVRSDKPYTFHNDSIEDV